ncbi:TPA: hypothetical protein DDW35_05385 [Candidatus Sumerlaeota bacterium]|jgi:phage shock protein B|nr:hypothetical protein [Candidatus Sumerlaeota bacterium]
MHNKGCLVAILGAGVLCAFLVLAILGLFVGRVEVRDTPTRMHDNDGAHSQNVEVYTSSRQGPSFFQEKNWRETRALLPGILTHCIVFAVFAVIIVLILRVILRGNRKPRSCCAPADTDDVSEIRQMYASFKRMEQRLQTLETILTDRVKK